MSKTMKAKKKSGKGLFEARPVPLDQIVMPSKDLIVRDKPGDISELKSSIQKSGLINPLTVRPTKGGKFELLCGHRRHAALRSAGIKEVPVVIRTDLVDDIAALSVIMSENSEDARTAPTPIEQARVFQRLHKKFGADRGAAVKVSRACGCSDQHVRNMLRVLEAPKPLQDRLRAGKVSTELVVNFQQIEDEKTRKAMLKAVDGGEVKTLSDLKSAQADYAASLRESGKEAAKPSDKRKQGGGGGGSSANVIAWREKREQKEMLDTLLAEYNAAVTEKDESTQEVRKNQIALMFWVMGMVGSLDTDKKGFEKLLESEADRVAELYADESGEEEGEDDEDEGESKKSKTAKKSRRKAEAEDGDDDEDSEESEDDESDESDDDGEEAGGDDDAEDSAEEEE